ncbi:MAG: J domain-containing protein [Planctomycetota bacterium]|nr:J domain-containing protein [Planctomycetota bacterium]MDA1141494.1 J domain-containing protein [Planctomycetota bacterium]
MQNDPFKILELREQCSDEEVRQAYLKKLKQFPPDKEPLEFERIRDAYEQIKDPRRRIQRTLLAADPRQPFTQLLDDAISRKFIGPEVWLEVVRNG